METAALNAHPYSCLFSPFAFPKQNLITEVNDFTVAQRPSVVLGSMEDVVLGDWSHVCG